MLESSSTGFCIRSRKDTILKFHHPEWIRFRIDLSQMAQSRMAPLRMSTLSNVHHYEWTPLRMDTIPNGHNPKWTQTFKSLTRTLKIIYSIFYNARKYFQEFFE